MTDAKTRSDRIRDKIDASGAQMPANGHAHLPDAYPPDSYRSLAGEYPWLAIAAGAGAGLLLGALLPRSFTSKVGRRAVGLQRLYPDAIAVPLLPHLAHPKTAAPQALHLACQLARQPAVVGVEHRQVVAAGFPSSPISRRPRSASSLTKKHAMPGLANLSIEFLRRQVRTVIDHQEFEVNPLLSKHGLHGATHRRIAIEVGDDDGHLGNTHDSRSLPARKGTPGK